MDLTDVYALNSKVFFWKNKIASETELQIILANLQTFLEEVPEKSLRKLKVNFPQFTPIEEPGIQRALHWLGSIGSVTAIAIGERFKGAAFFLVYTALGSHTHTKIRYSAALRNGVEAIHACMDGYRHKLSYNTAAVKEANDAYSLIFGTVFPVRFGANKEKFLHSEHKSEVLQNNYLMFD